MDYYDGDNPGKGEKGCEGSGSDFVQPGEKDTQVQLIISLALGLTAFVAFCVSSLSVGDEDGNYYEADALTVADSC